jgi:sensor histidine kinase YesM
MTVENEQQVKSHWVLRNLAISLAAAIVTPAFVLLLSPGPITVRNLASTFVISAVYATAITFLSDAVLARVHRRVQQWKPLGQWTVLVVMLVTLSTIGCLIATALFVAVNTAFPEALFGWAEFWPSFWQALKLCVFITVVFGLSIAAYEELRGRLDAAELKLRTEELERERALKLATEARLASLQARIHPHFLFNTLNSISSLIPGDPERAERLIERMAALLRFSLDAHRGGLVPIEEELKIVRDYLDIEKTRLGHRLQYRVDAAQELTATTVPPLSIQTLVENSIKYAVAPNREGGEILVRAGRNNGCLRVDVADTGSGFTLESAPPGHGLDNLRAQLKVLYGDAAELTVHRSQGWTTVTFKVPA